MSASPDTSQPEFFGLENLPTSAIDPNPENPRLIFPQEEIDRLAESIANEGILVPVVVYPYAERYVLIDGERRFKCAQILGLGSVPAVITKPKSKRENLVQMFNIHLVREPWRDMPTAWALNKLIQELAAETGKIPSDAELSDLTGLSREKIARLRHALSLSKEYQAYINEGRIPLNWFWELKRNVIDPLAKQRPKIIEEFTTEGVLDAMVVKRLDGVITDTVSLRDVRPIIAFAAKDAQTSEDDTSILDGTIKNLLTDPELTIETAYEDTVQIMVEVDKLARRTENMITSFRRLIARVRTEEERAHVFRVGNKLIAELGEILS